jgi:hypothetical protein
MVDSRKPTRMASMQDRLLPLTMPSKASGSQSKDAPDESSLHDMSENSVVRTLNANMDMSILDDLKVIGSPSACSGGSLKSFRASSSADFAQLVEDKGLSPKHSKESTRASSSPDFAQLAHHDESDDAHLASPSC